ncbi:MAG: nuclear transport factor 2 family protein [Paludibacter sp.]|jgi:ketosteroid isomerase-like protein|nr:nuclear transport factor 2 family protein [Paludibacter sp.]MDD4033466.1 nuclear transport factor 2 family protein [Bacteroidales bacterium]MDD4500258.1 nuclear transport factor 2 family protein [Bacteroidales bacterium]
MKTFLLIAWVMITLTGCSSGNTDISEEIISLEKAALEKWNRGDIYGYLDLYAEDIVYFDPMIDKRMDGLQKIKEYYESWEGEINVTECEMIDPKVQAVKDMAVLTFNLRSVEGDSLYQWNCTEVYRKDRGKWLIIQTHWSYVKPNVK